MLELKSQKVERPAAATHMVDLAFEVHGETVPRDHGYLLYAALAKALPFLHAAEDIGIHPLHGAVREGRLYLDKEARLQMRLPLARLGDVGHLMGASLDIGGAIVRIGPFRAFPLRPRAALRSRLVTIKGFLEPETFNDALLRQAQALEIEGKWSIGARRVMEIHGRKIVGFEVLAENLGIEASLALQTWGIGGKRKMGCGLFVPARI